ncbi:MAG: NBR1-Ig-like domain-containing protein [Chloroflexi bacterium]|nr:NBR1-Ig-like domain-containing protein [Chloroflexota bacterium]
MQPGGLSNGRFVADVTVPDDTEIQPGKSFTKTWRVQNNGSRAWGQGFTIRFAGGVLMSAQTSYAPPAAQPGQAVEISINMTAPDRPGTHYADWRLHDDRGEVFGEIIYVRIVVPGSRAIHWCCPFRSVIHAGRINGWGWLAPRRRLANGAACSPVLP